MRCPESIEELEAMERMLPLCRKSLYELAQAKINSGMASSGREAERQISEEIGRSEETIHKAIQREKASLGTVSPEEYVNNLDLPPLPISCHTKDTIALKWTGDHESYTPAKYIEAVRKTMGSIDTDPASNSEAQKIVKAGVYYSKDDDGLLKEWKGNVFLNPPYSHPEIKYFVDKLLNELTDDQQAILLTNNNTDTNFFHAAASRADAVCFTKGRINFYKPDNSLSSPTNGQVFYYFGDRVDKFIQYFSEFGIIMTAI